MKFVDLMRHFREMKWYFAAVIGLFAFGIVLGSNHWMEDQIQQQLREIGNIVKSIEGKPSEEWALFVAIFQNNVSAMFMMLLLGLFFGIMPFVSLFVNGLVIGYVGSLSMQQISFLEFAKAIVPHGIFEIPALLLAGAYGLRLGAFAFRGIGVIASRERRPAYAADVKRMAKLLVPLALLLLGLLFVAAIIESTFTKWLVT